MTNGAPAQKKGLSTFAWIAIGCGGLIIVALIAFVGLSIFAVNKGKEMVADAAGSDSFSDFVEDLQENPAKTTAQTMIRLNPELDIDSVDDEAGTITFTNNRTGEQATLNFDDIAEGRFSMTTEEGEYRVDASQGGEGGVTLSGPDGQETRIGGASDLSDVPEWVPLYPDAESVQSLFSSGSTGVVTAKTSDDAQKVVDHYKSLFERAGWTIGGQSMTTTGDGAFGGINGELDGRTINVGVTEQQGEVSVTINYNGKAE